MQPVVSICCLAYNHEKYIRQAIDGFLMQQTSFPFEILIHDDASTDETATIVKDYEKKYPEIIKPIYQKENQHSKGISVSATYNWPRVKGKYIALCEGDDYWTDPFKLQKQVDFLDKNHDFAATTHQARIIFEDCETPSRLFNEHGLSIIKTKDIIEGRLFHTASLIFRSEIIKKNTLPNNITSGDRALNFLIAAYGKIQYINEPMCIYRRTSSGISAWVTMEYMEKDLNMLPWIRKIDKNFPSQKYARFIHYTILEYPKFLAQKKMIKHSFMIIYYLILDLPSSYKQLKTFLRHGLLRYWRKAQINNLQQNKI
jgi:glycosyltransferase involved in cell wall biosynthesis